MLKYFLFIGMIFGTYQLRAQDSAAPATPDTLRKAVVVRPRHVPKKPVAQAKDSVLRDSSVNPFSSRLPAVHLPAQLDSPIFRNHPFYRFTNPVRFTVTLRQWQGKEAIFYAMMALLIFFALIRNGFSRYIKDLFKIFFRTTVNQRQIKEQLLQSPLPSLLLNIFFLLSVGMFVTLVMQYFKLGQGYNFWMLFLYAVLGLAGIYGVKYLSLKLLGWILQVSDSTDNYIFIVFATNKVMGIAILPFLVALAFSYGFLSQAAMNLSIVVIVCLFAYRFFLSYMTIHRQVKIHFFHFLLYLCAFELVPLLLINKLLFSLLGETY